MISKEIDSKVKESIKWLDENLVPWELILQHWLITFDIPGDMTLIKEEARKTAEILKITLQSYIVILGSLSEVKEIYVQIDDILYKTNSTLKAIDVCFKIFHVFQVSYPLMSEHFWMLIQKGIYNLNTKWDSIIPSTQHILSKISNINCEGSDKSN
ncbi:uncharacterized protein [Anoplolepis gracilipes]|uniref:uncharacterized protein n=1 Tax=Anoplolepis gracilipes TaxID=354296 RepID=UPI003BA2B004